MQHAASDRPPKHRLRIPWLLLCAHLPFQAPRTAPSPPHPAAPHPTLVSAVSSFCARSSSCITCSCRRRSSLCSRQSSCDQGGDIHRS